MAKQIVVSDSAELVFKLFERYQGKKWIDYFDKKIDIEDYLKYWEDTTIFSTVLFRHLSGLEPLDSLDKIADLVTLVVINDDPVNSLWDCERFGINVPFYIMMREHLLSIVKKFKNAKVVTYTEYLKGDFA